MNLGVLLILLGILVAMFVHSGLGLLMAIVGFLLMAIVGFLLLVIPALRS